MTRIHARLLQVIAAIAFVMLPAADSSGAFLSYATSTSAAIPGDTFTLSVNLVAGTSPFAFTNFDNFVSYDATLVTPISFTVGSFLSTIPGFSTVVNPTYATGIAYQSGSSANLVSLSSGNTLNELVVFTFRVNVGASGVASFSTVPSVGGATSNFYDTTSSNPDLPLSMGAPSPASVTISNVVPEPSSFVLIGVGLVGLRLLSYRRMRLGSVLIPLRTVAIHEEPKRRIHRS